MRVSKLAFMAMFAGLMAVSAFGTELMSYTDRVIASGDQEKMSALLDKILTEKNNCDALAEKPDSCFGLENDIVKLETALKSL